MKASQLLLRVVYILAVVGLLNAATIRTACGQVVPGTGMKVKQVGDDFEDPNWKFDFNFPKSSDELDHQKRLPTGRSKNGRLYEPTKRGEPDVIRRVPTPDGGLYGSNGSLLLRTVQSGIPGRPSGKMQQDDLCMNVAGSMGGPIPVSRSPNFVVRVYVPPLNEWEPRTGPSFGVRGSCFAHTQEKWFFSTTSKLEEYWPGFFFCLYRAADGKGPHDYAALSVRGDRLGNDFFGPRITPGWWTVGMSFTPDGQCHYYARAGVADLTEQDRFYSQYPYGFKCETLETFFFNVCNLDDGHTASTAWIIDDPMLYVLR